ncbi:MAG: quinolinate synthase NadA [Candidatus Omnitrophota bacterium]
MYNKKFDDNAYKAELIEKIRVLRKEKNAVIIAHNYQRDEIQAIADYHGDSLALAQAAVRTDASIIVFCGVHFMAESAAILNPGKKVLLPVEEAGCPLADMITVEKLRAKRKECPDAAVVSYVNTSAEIKAESDITCTSSNAVQVVRSLSEKRVIFVPDRNLGHYVQTQVPEKEIILWEGFCPTHIRLNAQDIVAAQKKWPGSEFIAHPECDPEVLEFADSICSTGGMFTYAKQSKAKRFIIGTETGMLYRLRIENPDKEFFSPTNHLVCANMKLTTLGWVLHSLENEIYEVKVDDAITEGAKRALDRMLEVSKSKK